MVQISELVGYCDRLLDAPAFADYAPNGLQVEGAPAVERLISGVTASGRFLDRAIEADAGAVLVHHGYFWKGEDPRIVGMKAARMRRLLAHGISLIAYHLPLDAHAELGNNARLGAGLGLSAEGASTAAGIPGLLWQGRAAAPVPAGDFAERIRETLGRAPTHVEGGPAAIERVAICTGAGQRFLSQAAAQGADAFISGEISEPTAHEARELGIHYFAAGHHATERFGVAALGEHLAAHFGVEHCFIDDDNPA